MVATVNFFALASLLATIATASPLVTSGGRLDVGDESLPQDPPKTTGIPPTNAGQVSSPKETTTAPPAGTTNTTMGQTTSQVSNSTNPTKLGYKLLTPRPPVEKWTLDESWEGEQFFEQGWQWFTDDDPTYGRVNYIDKETSRNKGLAWSNGTLFGMSADYYNKVDPAARGRDSVRINTLKTWTDAVFVVDVRHMPTGCATWPAFWSVGEGRKWPDAGEIDIIEGTNIDTVNLMSVHTGFNTSCGVPQDRRTLPGMEFTGSEGSNLCDGDKGCNVRAPKPNSFGAALNAEGGGFYVTRRDARGVSMWFWPHSAGDIPDTILNPTGELDEKALGVKIADFPITDSCAMMDNHLAPQRLIFNLTFCGGWGGYRFDGSGCKEKLNLDVTCKEYVDNHPEGFKDAWWLVGGVRVYVPASS